MRSFTLRVVVEERASAVLDFHRDRLTEYLWPRTREDFVELALQECLYEVVETTRGVSDLVGICYVMNSTEPDDERVERSEFGGVFIDEPRRGYGIATALGIVAISNHFAWDPPRGRLIAHVHEANPDPRGMLQDQLGFLLVGEEIPPRDIAPASMARNEHGDVVGDVFQFNRVTLSRFADWIERFDGTLHGKQGPSNLDVELDLLRQSRTSAVATLRAIASKS